LYRAVAILVDVEGYAYEEAADILGVPVGTVKSRLARARVQLRLLLGKMEELTVSPLWFTVRADSHQIPAV
jgi:RNA polymerase sigma-70 factor (ECF subfamily)